MLVYISKRYKGFDRGRPGEVNQMHPLMFPSPRVMGVGSSFGIKWNTIQLYYIFADDDMWDDEASLDYRQALTLEMKRQQIQRELQQMEEEEEAREQAELIQQKEVSPGAQFHKTSATILCLRIIP